MKEAQMHDMKRALNFMHPDVEGCFELTALKVTKSKCPVYGGDWIGVGGNASGYFDDTSTAIEKALQLDQQAEAQNIAITLNPVGSDLLARAYNRIKKCEHRTADQDVLKIVHVLIDCDPVRPSGISSNNDEHELALQSTSRVKDHLTQEGFPPPLESDSGNGGHLIYKVKLLNTPEDVGLIERFLKALSVKFTTDKVSIDTSVGNPGRLVKLPGTKARKGDDMLDRPHRQSKIISCPEDPQIVSRELLEKIASEPIPEPESNDEKAAASSPEPVADLDQNFDVEAYLDHYGIKVLKVKKTAEATLYILDSCVFNLSHSPGKATIIQNKDGKLVYQCHHNSCSDKTWSEARKKISGDDDFSQFMKKQTLKNRQRFERKKPVPITAVDLSNMVFEDINWIIENLISEGVALLCGPPKICKSFLMLNTAFAVSAGTSIIGYEINRPKGVFYLALEDDERRLKSRMDTCWGDRPVPGNLTFYTEWNSFNNGGLDDLRNELQERPEVKLVIIDTFGMLSSAKSKGNNLYVSDVNAISDIKAVAKEFHIAIILVHHSRKAEADDYLNQISGTTGISGTVDTILVLQKARNQSDAILKVTGRDIEEREINMRFKKENCTWELIGDSDVPTYSEKEQMIIDLINSTGTQMRSKEIESAMAEQGVNGSTARSLLSRMIGSGVLIKVDKGIYITQTLNTLNQHNNTTRSTMATEATNSTRQQGFVGCVATLPGYDDQHDCDRDQECHNCTHWRMEFTDDNCEIETCIAKNNQLISPEDNAINCEQFQRVA